MLLATSAWLLPAGLTQPGTRLFPSHKHLIATPSSLTELLYGEHGLVPCFDELAVVIPEIPAHFERGQFCERRAPVEAVLAATLPPPAVAPFIMDVRTKGGGGLIQKQT